MYNQVMSGLWMQELPWQGVMAEESWQGGWWEGWQGLAGLAIVIGVVLLVSSWRKQRRARKRMG